MQGSTAFGSSPMVKDTGDVDLESRPSVESGQRAIEPSQNEGYRHTILPISPKPTAIGSYLEKTTQEQPELLESSRRRSDQNDSPLPNPPNSTLPQRGDTAMLPQHVREPDTPPPSTHDWVIGHQLGVVCRGRIAGGAFGEVHSVLPGSKLLANITIDVGQLFSGIIASGPEKYRR